MILSGFGFGVWGAGLGLRVLGMGSRVKDLSFSI
jgi:hypothetical protein